MKLHTMRSLFGASALLMMAASASVLAADRPRPSFLVIITDDQTYRAIGYQNDRVQTPELDQLAREGVIFSRAYVASPICAASRASMLTGRFPQQHGSVALDRSGFRQKVVDKGKYRTIAQRLKANGYITAFSGKSHLGDVGGYGFARGQRHGGNRDRKVFATAERLIKGMAKEDRPFFLWVATRQPHLSLRPKKKWLAKYDSRELKVAPNFRRKPPRSSLFNQGLPGQHYYRDSNHTGNYKNLPAGPPRSKKQIRQFKKAYYATISHLDHQVGQLVDTLRSAGVYEKTILLFTSDHGYFLGNHGLGNKITMHEESVRVPMFAHGPPLPASGIKTDALVSSLDLYPTLLELAGLEPPSGVAGKSLVPLLSDPQRKLREYVASECVGVGGKLGQGHRMIRTDRWKYILSGTNEEALYNETEDPYELDNLVDEPGHRDVLQRLRDRMRQWMKCVGDTHERPPSGGS